MRRKSQPARGALPLAASHGGMVAVPGPTGSGTADVGAGAAGAGPLALAVSAVGGATDGGIAHTVTHTVPHAASTHMAATHAGSMHAGSMHASSTHATAAHAVSHERLSERAERRRLLRHSGSHAAVLGRHADVPDLTAPAAPVYLVPDTPDVGEDRSRVVARSIKRTVDLLGAVLGLLLAAPLLVLLAVIVRLGSPGPVFFAQARVGRGGRVFRCYKFRTMRHDAESLLCTDPELRATYERHGFKIPCDADHRVTPIGRMLRLTSCDELPQLWNVLKGEMSLVGPRPLVARELAHYPGADRDVLLSVRPGLTGAWAVGGRSRVGYPERAWMELNYVREWSIGRDLLILLRTVGAVLARRGAS